MRRYALPLIPFVALALATSVLALEPPAPKQADGAAAEVNPRWLLRLDGDDRKFIDDLIGHAPPAFTDDLKWIGGSAKTWADLAGKVVVLQTWTSQNTAGRTWPARAARAVKGWTDNDVVVIAIHTPEGADRAAQFMERRELDMPAAVDTTGAFCDALGAYKKPVNFVIDRAGTVRYAGLNEEALTQAAAELVEEKASELPEPKVRDTEAKEDTGPKPPFPPITGSVGSAMDVRGKKAPEFFVQEWIANRPKGIENKVVIIDFWATWCGPCVAAIPHMNEIAAEFPNDVAVIGITSEKRGDFDKGIKKVPTRIQYSIALDASSKMANAIQIRGIPHVIVLSSDWVVRWQGHPGAGLTKEVVKQIVDANGGGSAKADPRLRWAKDKQ